MPFSSSVLVALIVAGVVATSASQPRIIRSASQPRIIRSASQTRIIRSDSNTGLCKGCRLNGQCIQEGEIYRKDCRVFECASEERGLVQYYRLQPTTEDQCSWNGQCVEKNKPFNSSQCIRHICRSTGNGYKFKVLELGCELDDGCVKLGATVEVDCRVLQCRKWRRDDGTFIGLKAKSGGGCKHRNRCVKLGETLTEGCRVFKCRKKGNSTMIGLMPTSEDKCPWQDRCVEKNKGFETSKCQEMICNGTEGRGLSYEVLKEGCRRKNRCVPINETVQENCRLWQCQKFERDGKTYLGLKPAKGDKCPWNDKCMELNQPFETNKCQKHICLPTEYGGLKYEAYKKEDWGCYVSQLDQCVKQGVFSLKGMDCTCDSDGSWRCSSASAVMR